MTDPQAHDCPTCGTKMHWKFLKKDTCPCCDTQKAEIHGWVFERGPTPNGFGTLCGDYITITPPENTAGMPTTQFDMSKLTGSMGAPSTVLRGLAEAILQSSARKIPRPVADDRMTSYLQKKAKAAGYGPDQLDSRLAHFAGLIIADVAPSVAEETAQDTGIDHWQDMERDTRPQRGGWAPGKYWNKCSCGRDFIGDKRAVECAPCAYRRLDEKGNLKAHYDGSAHRMTLCQADDDGDCTWHECPQLRDKEPGATGRHCPLDGDNAAEAWAALQKAREGRKSPYKFRAGDLVQAFLRSPDCPEGSWTPPVAITAEEADRINGGFDNVARRVYPGDDSEEETHG